MIHRLLDERQASLIEGGGGVGGVVGGDEFMDWVDLDRSIECAWNARPIAPAGGTAPREWSAAPHRASRQPIGGKGGAGGEPGLHHAWDAPWATYWALLGLLRLAGTVPWANRAGASVPMPGAYGGGAYGGGAYDP